MQKTSVSVLMRLRVNYTEKIREKMKNRSHIYDISTKPRHRYECTKYKMCLSMVIGYVQ